MSTWLVTRHPGALQWLRRHGYRDARHVSHLDIELVAKGDTVIGTLPVWMVAAVTQRGARYFHLTIPLDAACRGAELTADELDRLGARLQRYLVCLAPEDARRAGPGKLSDR
ncbi:CRISPR-associated protein Csx16 [Aquisalimonas sp.]|uniref:CRISPR-associated protein Csx16 n=1 Tax=Aquisalimonas sp. TaxID=1872621 RepID=UPI0025C130C7|nr:CRISPR-associated protein Csx16 [Aquisalimonas sp.]